MPKKGEKARKIASLKAGKGVRAPKKYWERISEETAEEYPKLSPERRARITGARWKKISRKEKIKIIKKF